MVLGFEQALATVREKLAEGSPVVSLETAPLREACHRVLGQDVASDRDCPTFHRSTRDGFAVRVPDVKAVPVLLPVAGEARAGQPFPRRMQAGECVQIMTGAPLPEGADAVVMVEHTRAGGSGIEILRAAAFFENVVRQGSEAAQGARILTRGRRLGAGELGLLASVGVCDVVVCRKPSVAILSTGDEVVAVERRPEWFQIRNSNSITLRAAVEAAGGVPHELGNAGDEKETLRRRIEECFQADLILITGGVSAGKYDFVEEVLGELGAEFYFDGVAIRPGKPLVFGRARGKLFFGLPGNPVSTFVTFHLFVRPALEALGGAEFESPLFLRARMGKPLESRAGLTIFMPARVQMQSGDPVVNLVGWQGSGDLTGLAQANCFVVLHPGQPGPAAGDWVDVLPKPV